MDDSVWRPQIAAGKSYSVVVDEEGKLWAMGQNKFSSLSGIMEENAVAKFPFMHPNVENVIAVWSSGYNVIFIDSNGKVTHTGSLLYGNNVAPPSSVKMAAFGAAHRVLLTEEGDVWMTGSNSGGQLALGPEFSKIEIFIKLKDFSPSVFAVAAGAGFTLLLDDEGNIWYMGGQKMAYRVGFGEDNIHVPTKIRDLPPIVYITSGYHKIAAIDCNGGLWTTGKSFRNVDRNGLAKVPDIPPIKFISLGDQHTLLVDKNGEVWGKGANRYKQMGKLPLQVREFTKIPLLSDIHHCAAGETHSIFVDHSGNVFGLGNNLFGEIGLGSHSSKIDTRTQIKVPPVHIAVNRASKQKSARSVIQ